MEPVCGGYPLHSFRTFAEESVVAAAAAAFSLARSREHSRALASARKLGWLLEIQSRIRRAPRTVAVRSTGFIPRIFITIGVTALRALLLRRLSSRFSSRPPDGILPHFRDVNPDINAKTSIIRE